MSIMSDDIDSNEVEHVLLSDELKILNDLSSIDVAGLGEVVLINKKAFNKIIERTKEIERELDYVLQS